MHDKATVKKEKRAQIKKKKFEMLFYYSIYGENMKRRIK